MARAPACSSVPGRLWPDMRERTLKSVDPSLYDREYFLSHCEGYKQFLEGRISPRLKKAVDFLSPGQKLTILDVGCGRGEVAQYLVRQGHKCEGIDYSRDAVGIAAESAKQRLSDEQLSNCRFRFMDAKAMDFADDSFDAALMLDVVEHLYPWELDQVLREVKRTLRPGGRLLIHTVPNKWIIKPARLAMKVLGIPTETDRHVNEQSVFSLRKAVRPHFSGNVWIEKERGFWSFWAVSSDRLPNRGLGIMLRALDFLLDNRIVAPIVEAPPLVFFLGTDIWGDLTVGK